MLLKVGWMHKYRKIFNLSWWNNYWFVLNQVTCSLTYYKSPQQLKRVGEYLLSGNHVVWQGDRIGNIRLPPWLSAENLIYITSSKKRLILCCNHKSEAEAWNELLDTFRPEFFPHRQRITNRFIQQKLHTPDTPIINFKDYGANQKKAVGEIYKKQIEEYGLAEDSEDGLEEGQLKDGEDEDNDLQEENYIPAKTQRQLSYTPPFATSPFSPFSLQQQQFSPYNQLLQLQQLQQLQQIQQQQQMQSFSPQNLATVPYNQQTPVMDNNNMLSIMTKLVDLMAEEKQSGKKDKSKNCMEDNNSIISSKRRASKMREKDRYNKGRRIKSGRQVDGRKDEKLDMSLMTSFLENFKATNTSGKPMKIATDVSSYETLLEKRNRVSLLLKPNFTSEYAKRRAQRNEKVQDDATSMDETSKT